MVKSLEVRMFFKSTSGIIQGRHPGEVAGERKKSVDSGDRRVQILIVSTTVRLCFLVLCLLHL